jgi:hypothetical protein
MDEFMERTFMFNLFRKEIYIIAFEYIDKEYNIIKTYEGVDETRDKEQIFEVLYSILNDGDFKYDIAEEISNTQRFKDQIDCICYFDVVSLWNLIEYLRIANRYNYIQRTQTMVENCNLAWSIIAEYIIENEWEDIIECYRNN